MRSTPLLPCPPRRASRSRIGVSATQAPPPQTHSPRRRLAAKKARDAPEDREPGSRCQGPYGAPHRSDLSLSPRTANVRVVIAPKNNEYAICNVAMSKAKELRVPGAARRARPASALRPRLSAARRAVVSEGAAAGVPTGLVRIHRRGGRCRFGRPDGEGGDPRHRGRPDIAGAIAGGHAF